MQKAVHDLYPDAAFSIKHSVSKGFYCEIAGHDQLSADEVECIKARMDDIIDQDIPIVRERVLSSEAEEIYAQLGFEDKIALLHTRPRMYVDIYRMADMAGYFYGALAPSTSYIHLFDIRPYYNGLHLAVPRRTDPTSSKTSSRRTRCSTSSRSIRSG